MTKRLEWGREKQAQIGHFPGLTHKELDGVNENECSQLNSPPHREQQGECGAAFLGLWVKEASWRTGPANANNDQAPQAIRMTDIFRAKLCSSFIYPLLECGKSGAAGPRITTMWVVISPLLDRWDCPTIDNILAPSDR